MNLEQKLQKTAEPWLAGERLAPERAESLKALVQRRSRLRRVRRWLSLTAAAAAVVVGVVTGPLVVAVASGAPVIGPFIARMATFDQGAHWADEKGYVVPVDRSVSDKGYTYRIESVMADSARTVIYYVLEGPELEQLRPFPMPHVQYNVGGPLRGYMSRADWVDGRLVGSLELPPLPTPTALVRIRMGEIGEVAGDWSLSFMASRVELDRLGTAVELNQRFAGPGYDLVVKRALLAPTQTLVELEGTVGEGYELRPYAQLTVGGRETRFQRAFYETGNGKVTVQYAFDRVDPETAAEMVLTLSGLVRWQDVALSLPLVEGNRVEHGGFWLEFAGVKLAGGKTEVVARIPWTEANFQRSRDFADWAVLDTAGTAHGTMGGAHPQGDGTALLTFEVQGAVAEPVLLRAGRVAEPVPGDFAVRIPVQPVK